MKLGIQQLLLLVLTVKAQVTVTVKLCTDRDRTPKIVNQAWAPSGGLEMRIGQNRPFRLLMPYNTKREHDMTERYEGEIDGASTVSSDCSSYFNSL